MAKVNILIRTSDREKQFECCMKSIMMQKYEDWHLFISCDNDRAVHYASRILAKYSIVDKATVVKVKKGLDSNSGWLENGIRYKFMFHNTYLNELQKYVTGGFIMYLDDDDKFLLPTSLNSIMKYSTEKCIIFWRVQVENMVVPKIFPFHAPASGDISGIGFMFDSFYKDFAYWIPRNRSDFFVARNLFNNIRRKVYVNEVLTIAETKGWGKVGI